MNNSVRRLCSRLRLRTYCNLLLLCAIIPAAVSADDATAAITPGNVTLSPGQRQSFSVSTSNTVAGYFGFKWTISPAVGSIYNGVYVAPDTVASSQTVTVTATSYFDPTISASASIFLQPLAGPSPDPVSVSLTPSTVTLSNSQTQQFVATITGGTGDQGVLWSLTPSVGSLSNNGATAVYTAPSAINNNQTVQVTATSVSDPTKAATGSISLAAASPVAPVAQSVTLPIEVMGSAVTAVSTVFTVPDGVNLGGPLSLWLQIHGLRQQNQASVQVNGGAWTDINEDNVSVQGLASKFGGIGGGFSTLKMTLPLPNGSIQNGQNTITFRFNGTDGLSTGYRVLNFNILDANATQLVPLSQFVQDDPAGWQSPLPGAADIQAGQSLWKTAALSNPVSGSLKVHCGDCHTQDGRDLKYFNYSNHSIEVRSAFHGLTPLQGQQIASYIRSLDAPAPAQARPWNPPYQPGLGLDSKPVTEWAAGAGLDAVLDSDEAMLPAVAPTLTAADFDPNGYLNAREMAIDLQLPDWNHWLPTIHPVDAWGDSFTQSAFSTDYGNIRSELAISDPTRYYDARYDIWTWNAYRSVFLVPIEQSYPNSSWTMAQTNAVYSAAQWFMVKHWEIMHEFQLESFGQSFFAMPKADARAWPDNAAFFASPNMLHIPPSSPGVGNGLPVTHAYHSYIWYHLQLILDSGNQSTGTPIDWQYVYGFIKDLENLSREPNGMLQVAWLKKGLQISWQLLPGPDQEIYQTGWSPQINDFSRLVHPDWQLMWSATPAPTESAIMESYLINWLNSVHAFTPQQFYIGGWASPNEQVASIMDATFADRIYYSIPRLRYYGVSQQTVSALAAWAHTVWPYVDWTALTIQNCNPGGNPGNLICQ